VRDTANLALHLIAGCCHLVNLMARSQYHFRSIIKVS